MSNPLSGWINLLRWPQRLFVRSKLIPRDPCAELHIDPSKPLIYVLKTESVSDLLALERIAERLGLPSPSEEVVIGGQSFPRYFCVQGRNPLFGKVNDGNQFISRFTQLIQSVRQQPALEIQLVPVALFWGRKPGQEPDTMTQAVLEEERASWLRKLMIILFLGRDNFVRFSRPISLRQMADEHGSDERIGHKLSRLARFHFYRQKLATVGPRLQSHRQMTGSLLSSPELQDAMQERARVKKLTPEQVRAEAIGYIDEIAATYSERLLRIGDRLLTWLWNKLYRGINVTNAEQVRQLSEDGHELVFVPCHRSHMDYLLLSYVIYRQGLMPPHIAAGINLNFWPAGPLFRKGGAFFMRRSFRGNKLYAAVFREYLCQLFSKGYSVKYFTEGGRSRTGRLLPPKTGMLAMTVQGLMRGLDRPVTLIPVYLGYDHVMEVATYHKELKGKSKEKESLGQVFKTLRKLKNFGQGYVNFGSPISLNQFLDQQAPQWQDTPYAPDAPKPSWLTPTVNKLANEVMTGINNSAAVSAVTLCATALLGMERHMATRVQLEQQLQLYLDLLRDVAYTDRVTVPDLDGKALLAQALVLDKFSISQDALGEMVSLDTSGAVSMTYYRNNILHVMAIPSLIASILVYRQRIGGDALLTLVQRLYPLIKSELFLGFDDDALPEYVRRILVSFETLGLLQRDGDALLPATETLPQLIILAQHIQETLQRYCITLQLMERQPGIERGQLERESQVLAERLSKLHGINAPEFFDKKVLSTLVSSLREQGYIGEEVSLDKVTALAADVRSLMRPEVVATVADSL